MPSISRSIKLPIQVHSPSALTPSEQGMQLERSDRDELPSGHFTQLSLSLTALESITKPGLQRHLVAG